MGETKTGVAHASLTYYRRCSGATSDSSSTLGLGQGIYLSIYLGINSWLLLLLLQLLLRPIISRLSSREVQTAVVLFYWIVCFPADRAPPTGLHLLR